MNVVMPYRMMPSCVDVAPPRSRIPLHGSVPRGQTHIVFMPLPPNSRNLLHSVYSPFAQPQLPPAQLMDRSVLAQQQHLCHSSDAAAATAAAGGNVLHPFPFAPMPLLNPVVPQCWLPTPNSEQQAAQMNNAGPQLPEKRSSPMNTHQAEPLFAQKRTVVRETCPLADESRLQFTGRELHATPATRIRNRDGVVNVMEHPSSQLFPSSGNSPVTNAVQSSLHSRACEKSGNGSMPFSSGDSSLLWTDCKAHQTDTLATLVRNIVEPETPNQTAVGSGSIWTTSPIVEDKSWTKLADGENIWSGADAAICGSHSDSEQSRKLKHPAICSVLDANAVHTSQLTASTVTSHRCMASTAADTRLRGHRDIWPNTFGPLTTGFPQNTVDSVSHLPPGLETQVLSRVGVIGHRGTQTSAESSSSKLNSVISDRQSSGSSIELSYASLASETTICESESARFDVVVPSQEPVAADDSANCSSLFDVISAMTVQPHQMNATALCNKSNSQDENAAQHEQQCDRLCTAASDSDICAASLSSDADSTLNRP